MGRGFLRWAFDNPAYLRTVTHPDVERYADEGLMAVMADFEATVRGAIVATQAAGRHPEADLRVLEVFTNSVPFGAAMMLAQPVFSKSLGDKDPDTFIAELVELVCPIAGRQGADQSPDRSR